MIDKAKFNEWANDYDTSVTNSKKDNKYPFAGYDELMSEIYNEVKSNAKLKILDIGFGTAKLTSKLYNDGHSITGIDFSSEMIKIAKEKMENAELILWDFKNGIPKELKDKEFDVIISTYALHHLENEMKVSLINELKNHLTKNGLVLIGDVAFKNLESHNQCRALAGEAWDEEEIYIKFNEIKKFLNYSNISFKIVSFCAGIVRLNK